MRKTAKRRRDVEREIHSSKRKLMSQKKKSYEMCTCRLVLWTTEWYSVLPFRRLASEWNVDELSCDDVDDYDGRECWDCAERGERDRGRCARAHMASFALCFQLSKEGMTDTENNIKV